MNILSLFDGISCGQVALNRACIKYNNYFASEIDKYAIKITSKNYPNTIQLGSIEDWKQWNLPSIDLVMGGSPCQGFSSAGLGLNFEDPRSKLFFHFVDILRYLKPKYFLLENVKMKKEWSDVITSYMGVEPILINSSLVSAQNRNRLYWTNIPNINQPDDKNILLKNILIDGFCDRTKSFCIDASYYKGGSLDSYFRKSRRQIIFFEYPGAGFEINRRIYLQHGKSSTLLSRGESSSPKIYLDKNNYRHLTPIECERLQTLPDNYTEGIPKTYRYKSIGNGWTVDIIAHILRNIKL